MRPTKGYFKRLPPCVRHILEREGDLNSTNAHIEYELMFIPHEYESIRKYKSHILHTGGFRLVRDFYTKHTTKDNVNHAEIKLAIQSGNKRIFWYLMDTVDIHYGRQLAYYVPNHLMFPIIDLGYHSWFDDLVQRRPDGMKRVFRDYDECLMTRAIFRQDVQMIERLLRGGVWLDSSLIDDALWYLERDILDMGGNQNDVIAERHHFKSGIYSILKQLKPNGGISEEAILRLIPHNEDAKN